MRLLERIGIIFDAATSILIDCILAGGQVMTFDELRGVEEILHNRVCQSVDLRLRNTKRGLGLECSLRNSVLYSSET